MPGGTAHESVNPLKGIPVTDRTEVLIVKFIVVFVSSFCLSGEEMWCIMTIVSCILIVHYIMLMSFVLVYVTYCAYVVSGVPHVLYVLNLLSTIKLYLSKSAKSRQTQA